MNTISWTLLKERVRKRKGWIAVGNTLIITGLLSFDNHPEWGYLCAAIGFVITMTSLLKKVR